MRAAITLVRLHHGVFSAWGNDVRFRKLVSALAAATMTIAVQSAVAQTTDVKQSLNKIDFSLASLTPPWINAIGEFDDDAPERFEEFIKAHKDEVKTGTTVQFLSFGGSLFAGMEVGAIIQQHGLNTYVGNSDYLKGDNVCASACTLAFIGGLSRVVKADARFSVHAPRMVRPDGSDYLPDEKVFSARDVSKEHKVMGALLRYVRNQGVDSLAVAAMYEVFPYGPLEGSSRKLTPQELVLWRIDNSVPVPLDVQQQVLHSDRLRRELCGPVQCTP